MQGRTPKEKKKKRPSFTTVYPWPATLEIQKDKNYVSFLI